MADRDVPSVDEKIEQLSRRFEIVSAIAMALEHPQRIISLMSEAADLDAGRSALMEAFALNDQQANAVTEIQFRRVTQENRDRVSGDLAELRAEIRRLNVVARRA